MSVCGSVDLWICGSMGPWISQTKTNFRNASSPSGLSLNLWNGDVRRKKKKSHDCNWGDECHKTIEVFKMMLEINHHQLHHQYYHHHHPATKEQGKQSLRLRLITFFFKGGCRMLDVGCPSVRPFPLLFSLLLSKTWSGHRKNTVSTEFCHGPQYCPDFYVYS